MTRTRMLGLAGLAVLLPALAAAQKTTYDFDRTATFAEYRTYAFKEGTSTGDPLVDARIVAALEDQLTLKGLSKTSTMPDVYVVFHMAYDKEKDISTFSSAPLYGGYGWGWGWGWGSTYTDVRVREILVGTLAVDIVDAARQKVAWRGLGTKEVDTKASPEERDKSITKAVTKIMRHYPPGAEDSE
jgi:hypothetical protein